MKVYRGHAGARQAWESFKGNVQLRVRFDDIRDLGESVLARGEMQTTGQTTQLVFNGEVAHSPSFATAMVVSFRDFGSHADALEAAGLRE
jgi:hypothetical protein